MMWFFRHFWIFISYHIFLLNQVEGAIAIPPAYAPVPLFCPSVCPSVCPSICLLTTFSGFCTFADKSLGRNGIELEMQMFPDDLPLANIDADGCCCHFMRSSVRPTIHGLEFVYCIQSAWKKWPTIWNADVSRWLTLSIHGCLWILLLVCLSVHLSVCSFTLVQPFGVLFFFCFFFRFFFLRLGLGQRRAVVIIGRRLLPSLVDTGDICCHYWQHILVGPLGINFNEILFGIQTFSFKNMHLKMSSAILSQPQCVNFDTVLVLKMPLSEPRNCSVYGYIYASLGLSELTLDIMPSSISHDVSMLFWRYDIHWLVWSYHSMIYFHNFVIFMFTNGTQIQKYCMDGKFCTIILTCV